MAKYKKDVKFRALLQPHVILHHVVFTSDDKMIVGGFGKGLRVYKFPDTEKPTIIDRVSFVNYLYKMSDSKLLVGTANSGLKIVNIN